jgi:class 3 adenylate cyclase/tetratricopeptide (TPR) repeat protein
MDVVAWLRGLGLERYAPAFRDNDVDDEVLPELTSDDLINIGVTSVGHRRKLLAAIALLGATPPAATVMAASCDAPAPADAERRQLTVMFCDLVGSTALSARLDPEDLREVIAAYHRAVTGIVAGFDGFVAKYMGDGVLVYFGYPRAHEDDAERAVRAGLGLIDAVGRLDIISGKLQARVGIATGLVVVGDLIGEGSAQEQSVVGETPNLAARLQALAEPDAVVIAAGTRRLVGNLFEYRDLGAVELKGIAAPVPASQVLRPSVVASRFEALRGSAMTPLVGRDEEIDLLLRRWARAKAGNGQVVLVSGEPGLGKSRIAAALEARLHAEAHLRLRYFCSPYHQDSALYPFIDQLGRASGFARDDPPAAKQEKLEAVLVRAAPPGEDVALLADLLSLPASERHPLPNLSPQRKKERTLEALIRQLEGLARRQPVMMVFEDAHWIDPTSRELLDLAVERVRSLPVLLIVTFRPEFQPPWTGQPQVTMLALSRLDRRERTGLVAQIAGGKTLPDEVVAQIADRTDGVPLFVEELTKSVLESGLLREEADRYVLDGALPPFAIPTSLHDSLMARLDRLASVRLVAQIGAAIGREFPYELVAAVAGRSDNELRNALDQLTEAGLVFRRGMPPHASYLFKHALVQDAAYSTLLRNSRQELHARIGKVLEERFPEIVETQPETLAHHFAAAAMNIEAIRYWQHAGECALRRSAHLEAVNHLKKALQSIKLLEPSRDRAEKELNLQLSLAAAFHIGRGQSALEAGEAYERARQLGEELGDARQLFRVLLGLYRFYAGVRFDLTHNLAARLLEVAQEAQDSDLLLQGHMAYGTAHLLLGDLVTAQHHLEEAIVRYSPERHRSHAVRFVLDPGVVSLSRAAWTLWFRGWPDQALDMNNRASALAHELGHVQSRAMTLFFGGMLHQFRREPEMVEELAQAIVTLSAEHALTEYAARGEFLLGWAITKQGRHSEGVHQMRESFAEYQRIGGALDLPWYLALLAEASDAIGEALATVGQAEQVIRSSGRASIYNAELCRLKGELLLAARRPTEGEQSFVSSLDIARQQGAKILELRTGACLARLWRDQGRRAEARDLLAPVYGCRPRGTLLGVNGSSLMRSASHGGSVRPRATRLRAPTLFGSPRLAATA